MATKTKGTNAKIKELKGIKPEKIDQDELNNLQATIRTTDKLTDDVGRLELQKYALLKAMEKIQENISDIRKSFMEKYGTDNINIQTGEIAYPADQEENGEINKED
jgi:chaperonin cofactor prefoldin